MSTSNQSFIPFSSQLGIAGTSYRLQMGRVNDKWASRLLKGSDVMESTIYNDADLPNANLVVGWCLKVIAIPNINPYQVMKTVQFLRKETERNWEESKTKVVASATEAREARDKLEKVPESELKRHAEVGWVKDQTGAPTPGTGAGTRVVTSTTSTASTPGIPSGDVQVRAITPEDKSRLRQKLPTIPGMVQAGAAATSAAPSAGGTTAARATGSSTGVITCKSCGFEIKICPVCGKPL